MGDNLPVIHSDVLLLILTAIREIDYEFTSIIVIDALHRERIGGEEDGCAQRPHYAD